MILKEASSNKELKKKAPHMFHLANDLTSIGKRLAFGVTVSLLLTIQLYQCYNISITTVHMMTMVNQPPIHPSIQYYDTDTHRTLADGIYVLLV